MVPSLESPHEISSRTSEAKLDTKQAYKHTYAPQGEGRKGKGREGKGRERKEKGRDNGIKPRILGCVSSSNNVLAPKGKKKKIFGRILELVARRKD